MSHIWRALVAEPKKTVDEHFGAILQELLKVCSMCLCSHCMACSVCVFTVRVCCSKCWLGLFLDAQAYLGPTCGVTTLLPDR